MAKNKGMNATQAKKPISNFGYANISKIAEIAGKSNL